MLMAAGLGTRLRPFSDRLAKPLVPVLGVPCAQFTIDSLVSSGVRKVVANIHHLPDSTRAGLGCLDLGGTDGASLVLSDESQELLGSAGGIRKALSHLGDQPFFVANADVLCSLDWSCLARRHAYLRRKWGVSVTLAVMPIPANALEDYRTIELDRDGDRIVGLGGKGRSGLMYVGCAVLEPEVFRSLPEGRPLELVPEVLEPAIRRGLAGVHVMPPDQNWIWLDVGSPALWWRAHMEMLQRLETAGMPDIWRRRIERAAVRRGPLMWTGREIHGRLDFSDSAGPLYWGAMQMGDVHPRGPARRIRMDAGSVIYGDLPPGASGPGIGALGYWASVSP